MGDGIETFESSRTVQKQTMKRILVATASRKSCVPALALRCESADYLYELGCSDTVDELKIIEPREPAFKIVVKTVGDDSKPLSGSGDEQETAKISAGQGNGTPGAPRTNDAGGIFRSSARQVKPAIKSFIESPNTSSRNGASINMIVLHSTTAATIEGTIQWFMDPKSQVSAHYIVDKNGDIYQMVRDERSAWHAKAINSRSIGIEHVATATDRLTDAQSKASAQLVRWLAAQYGIPAANVMGHGFAPCNEGTTDCPNHIFGDATADAVAKWVRTNVADALGSRELQRSRQFPGSRQGAAQPVPRRTPQLPDWARPSTGFARLRSDLSRIDQNVRRLDARPLPQSPAAALTALELMTIAIEDRRFFHHPGVDVLSFLREAIKVLRGRKHGGASTIDMQFVRTVTGYRAPTMKRKLYEAFLALVIRSRYKKLEILRSYLACAFFGSGLIGANAAAQRVFNKDADRLSMEEASFISAMLAYPRPLQGLPRWEQRARRRAAYAIAVFDRRKGRLTGPYGIAPLKPVL